MKTLKLYVVKSHVDKPLEEEIKNSKYEVQIQAGAALTEKRICDVNDHDGFPENYAFYESLADGKEFHFWNINIMKVDLFHEYCEWAFPMVDEYYKEIPLRQFS